MIFRQLLHRPSCSFSYLLARRAGGPALIVDPLDGELDTYLQLLRQLDLSLAMALATHSHGGLAALAELRRRTDCETVMGEASQCEGVTRRLADGEWFELDRMMMQALHTPGHTADSACFVLNDRVLTGDTLLIRSTGRTDLEEGDAEAQHESLHGKVLWLADHLLVFPAHDYKGWAVSTIAEEKAYNPRLQVKSAGEYAELMSGLDIDDAELMDQPRPSGPPWGLDAT